MDPTLRLVPCSSSPKYPIKCAIVPIIGPRFPKSCRLRIPLSYSFISVRVWDITLVNRHKFRTDKPSQDWMRICSHSLSLKIQQARDFIWTRILSITWARRGTSRALTFQGEIRIYFFGYLSRTIHMLTTKSCSKRTSSPVVPRGTRGWVTQLSKHYPPFWRDSIGKGRNKAKAKEGKKKERTRLWLGFGMNFDTWMNFISIRRFSHLSFSLSYSCFGGSLFHQDWGSTSRFVGRSQKWSQCQSPVFVPNEIFSHFPSWLEWKRKRPKDHLCDSGEHFEMRPWNGVSKRIAHKTTGVTLKDVGWFFWTIFTKRLKASNFRMGIRPFPCSNFFGTWRWPISKRKDGMNLRQSVSSFFWSELSCHLCGSSLD